MNKIEQRGALGAQDSPISRVVSGGFVRCAVLHRVSRSEHRLRVLLAVLDCDSTEIQPKHYRNTTVAG